MLDCTTDRYDTLYSRWLEDPGSLLDLAGYSPGGRLLDLCGGTGAVSSEAIRRGSDSSKITLLDLNPRARNLGIHQIRGQAEDVDHLVGPHDPFDVVICRQAIAYLDLAPTLRGVAAILRSGGVLAFNSFRRPRWGWRVYDYGGHRFLEASGHLLGWRVFHLQWGLGIGIDVTVFRWHRETEIQRALSEDFDVETHPTQNGIRWRCIRR